MAHAYAPQLHSSAGGYVAGWGGGAPAPAPARAPRAATYAPFQGPVAGRRAGGHLPPQTGTKQPPGGRSSVALGWEQDAVVPARRGLSQAGAFSVSQPPGGTSKLSLSHADADVPAVRWPQARARPVAGAYQIGGYAGNPPPLPTHEQQHVASAGSYGAPLSPVGVEHHSGSAPVPPAFGLDGVGAPRFGRRAAQPAYVDTCSSPASSYGSPLLRTPTKYNYAPPPARNDRPEWLAPLPVPSGTWPGPSTYAAVPHGFSYSRHGATTSSATGGVRYNGFSGINVVQPPGGRSEISFG